MKVAIGEDHKAAVLGLGVLAGLFFAYRAGHFVFGLCLEDDKGKTFLVKEQKIDKALGAFSKFSPRASRSCSLSVTLGSSWMLAGELPSAKKRQPQLRAIR